MIGHPPRRPHSGLASAACVHILAPQRRRVRPVPLGRAERGNQLGACSGALGRIRASCPVARIGRASPSAHPVGRQPTRGPRPARIRTPCCRRLRGDDRTGFAGRVRVSPMRRPPARARTRAPAWSADRPARLGPSAALAAGLLLLLAARLLLLPAPAGAGAPNPHGTAAPESPPAVAPPASPPNAAAAAVGRSSADAVTSRTGRSVLRAWDATD
jgi:hypothetical protein